MLKLKPFTHSVKIQIIQHCIKSFYFAGKSKFDPDHSNGTSLSQSQSVGLCRSKEGEGGGVERGCGGEAGTRMLMLRKGWRWREADKKRERDFTRISRRREIRPVRKKRHSFPPKACLDGVPEGRVEDQMRIRVTATREEEGRLHPGEDCCFWNQDPSPGRVLILPRLSELFSRL